MIDITSPKAVELSSAADDGEATGSILDVYVREAPEPQMAIDLFEGEWSSTVPIEGVVTGGVGLFDDPRIHWLVEQLGDALTEMSVLELGPLEAGHTAMLDQAGATVTAIESNGRAYLKCLIVKELLSLERSSFQFGDFLPMLEETDDRYDLVVASGVLYHAPDPVRLLEAIGRTSERVAIWTHFYEAESIAASPLNRLFVDDPITQERNGRELVLHRRAYEEALEWSGFCGGPEDTAVWMEKEGLLGLLEDLGFTSIETMSIDLEHPHGPCIMLLASR